MAKNGSKLKKWQRIFVNRSMNMGYIRAIGFDMDHTLAMYNRNAFEDLAFSETVKKLIKAGYPKEFSSLKFKHDFVIRGLLVDRERGNLLKVDGHKYVKTAFHGYLRLDKETRHKLYNKESYQAHKFLSVDTYFALSEVQLFAEIIEYMRHHPGKVKKSFKEVYDDIRKYIDLAHQDGSIKNKVLADIPKFIHRDKHLSKTLIRLVEAGKKLFLLTNSKWDYTSVVMSHLLDGEHDEYPKWQNYFHYIIVGSGKPGFFTESAPFCAVDTKTGLLQPQNEKIVEGSIYHGGNAQLLQECTGFKGDEILYVGDHIYGDIIQSKGILNWRTMLVVEELDHELLLIDRFAHELVKIREKFELREHLDEETQRLRSKINSARHHIDLLNERNDHKKAAHIHKEIAKLSEKLAATTDQFQDVEENLKQMLTAREAKFHPIWGQLMKVGLERSRFADQVEGYACIYTSRVSNLHFYSPFKKFSSAQDILPHDL